MSKSNNTTGNNTKAAPKGGLAVVVSKISSAPIPAIPASSSSSSSSSGNEIITMSRSVQHEFVATLGSFRNAVKLEELKVKLVYLLSYHGKYSASYPFVRTLRDLAVREPELLESTGKVNCGGLLKHELATLMMEPNSTIADDYATKHSWATTTWFDVAELFPKSLIMRQRSYEGAMLENYEMYCEPMTLANPATLTSKFEASHSVRPINRLLKLIITDLKSFKALLREKQAMDQPVDDVWQWKQITNEKTGAANKLYHAACLAMTMKIDDYLLGVPVGVEKQRGTEFDVDTDSAALATTLPPVSFTAPPKPVLHLHPIPHSSSSSSSSSTYLSELLQQRKELVHMIHETFQHVQPSAGSAAAAALEQRTKLLPSLQRSLDFVLDEIETHLARNATPAAALAITVAATQKKKPTGTGAAVPAESSSNKRQKKSNPLQPQEDVVFGL